MNGVVTHAGSTLLNVDALTEQQCRQELKRAQGEGFAKDLQIIELKRNYAAIERLLVRLLDHFINENFSKLHADMKPLAEHLQEQRAAKTARKVH
ncbi:hypothetical protein D9M68_437540 [compost metagenome]